MTLIQMKNIELFDGWSDGCDGSIEYDLFYETCMINVILISINRIFEVVIFFLMSYYNFVVDVDDDDDCHHFVCNEWHSSSFKNFKIINQQSLNRFVHFLLNSLLSSSP